MTRAICRVMLGMLGAALLFGGLAQAAEEQHTPQAYIVLVGVDKYQDPKITPRPYAEADAEALYTVFRDKERLGVSEENSRLLLGQGDKDKHAEAATHTNILKALHWVATKAKRDDLVVIGLFLQGAPLGERTCYLAVDSTLPDRSKNAVAAAEIEHELKTLKSQRVCLLLDVNFKGFEATKDPALELTVENLYKEFLPKEKDEREALLTGRVLLLANSGRKPSLEDKSKGHGLFAEVILDGLKGAADKDGYEPDGLITVHELVDYVDKKLPERNRELGKTKEEKEMSHVAVEGLASHFVLSHNPNAISKAKERLDKFAKLATDQNLPKDLVEEGTNLLERMPKLKAHQTLRENYQKLVDGKVDLDEFKKERRKILDGMQLASEGARGYAKKIMAAVGQVRDAYIEPKTPGELVGWAIRGLYQRLDEDMPKDIKEKLDSIKDLDEEALTDLLTDVRQRLGSREDLDKHKDVDFALQRMLGHLDPYTSYIDPETSNQFKRETQGRFTGIGIQIRKDPVSDQLLVVSPIKGSPAYLKGIKAGDLITHIKREMDSQGEPVDPPEVIPTKGLAIGDAVKKILGKPGTKVKLSVEREGHDSPMEFELTRGMIEVETVLGAFRKADDNWEYMIDPESKIGYVRLTSFATFSYRDLGKVVLRLSKQGIKGFILDLRFNPGGLLTSAVQISDLFIGDGKIVTIKPRNKGDEETHWGRMEESQLDFPMVVLVNGQSASGSEIVAACLQDHERAKIIGERSYGKGSVQNIQPFDDGQLRLTIATFWRPNGKNLNKRTTSGKEEDDWGVRPDRGFLVKLSPKEREELFEHQHKLEIIPNRELKPKEAPKEEFKDRQLEMALTYLRGQIKTAAQVPNRKAG